MKHQLPALLFLCLSLASVDGPAFGAPSSLDSVRLALTSGDLVRARALARAAFEADSSSAEARYLYATTLTDAPLAVRYFESVGADTTAPDSVRAASYGRCAGFAYANADYEKAGPLYARAWKISGDSTYQQFSRRCERLGKKDIDLSSALVPQKPKGSVFTLQVGSFGTLANAERQKAILARDFDDVRLSEASVKGTTYYRVHLGTFKDKDEAQAFARRNLRPKNVGFTVISE
jgi:hypothetical protein